MDLDDFIDGFLFIALLIGICAMMIFMCIAEDYKVKNTMTPEQKQIEQNKLNMRVKEVREEETKKQWDIFKAELKEEMENDIIYKENINITSEGDINN